MSDSYQAEISLWEARSNDTQVALERMREHRDDLQKENIKLTEQVKMYSSMVERMRIAMSEGREL